MGDSVLLPRSTPETQGLSSAAVRDFVEAAEQNLQHLHSFMLLRHGIVVAEGWWHPYRPEVPHMLFSLSKSFTSTAVGLAVAEGRLAVDEAVLKFFPAEAPARISQNLAAMQVRHLLSMSTGHDQDTTERSLRRRNPFKAFLQLPVEHAPGTHFVYNSGASYMLAAIVQKLTGQTLVEYLTPRLFAPLGIEGAVWASHPNGVNFGGWGLNLKTEDIARFGQLYLQKGQWNGQQLIPAAWVEAATSQQVANGDNPASDWNQGYGYQFWRCRHNCYRGDGAFGQYCLVMPEQDAVLVITAGLPDMQAGLNIIWEKLLPAMQAEPLPADAAAAELARTLTGLRLIPPAGGTTGELEAHLSGKTFIFEAKPARLSGKAFTLEPDLGTLHSLSFDFKTDTFSYRRRGGKQRGQHTLHFGRGAWVEGVASLGPPGLSKVAASGVWTDARTFALTICQFETPFRITITVRFDEAGVYYNFTTNVSFGPTEHPQLVGRMA